MAKPTTKVGNVTADPQLRFSDKGTAWTRFRMAVTPYTRKEKKQLQDKTEFYTIRCFRTLAEHVAESVSKGDRLIVQGDGEVEEYTTKEGEPGKQKVILANHVGVELRFCTVTIHKPKRRTTSEPASDTDETEKTDF